MSQTILKCPRLVKKFSNLTVGEERMIAHSLINGEEAVKVVTDYLKEEVVSIDKKLTDTEKLYGKPDAHLKVAVLLAKREAQLTLLNLLLIKITLDVDPTKEL